MIYSLQRSRDVGSSQTLGHSIELREVFTVKYPKADVCKFGNPGRLLTRAFTTDLSTALMTNVFLPPTSDSAEKSSLSAEYFLIKLSSLGVGVQEYIFLVAYI